MHCVNDEGKWSLEMPDNGVACVFRKLLVGGGGGGHPAPPHHCILLFCKIVYKKNAINE